ncbi:hypothetical protein [Crocinitomix algicola]|uniref:hypothetical protein n=1 Tax=Crocinitomix algicola TaxID=1740263 RepID=UPI00082F93D0|nr:hypothetical protein [Crocinitomix algicola]
MKFLKKSLLVICLAGSFIQGRAQGQASIAEGDLLINPSITLGWYNYGHSWDVINILPPVALNFEYAASNLFSFGFEGEYARRTYKHLYYFYDTDQYKYTYKSFMVRGSFHYLDVIKNIFGDDLGDFNSEKLDFYIGASTGMVITNVLTTWTDPLTEKVREKKDFDSTWRFGYFAGFRYYFNNSVGAFAETGRNSLGWMKLGLTLKI